MHFLFLKPENRVPFLFGGHWWPIALSKPAQERAVKDAGALGEQLLTPGYPPETQLQSSCEEVH